MTKQLLSGLIIGLLANLAGIFLYVFFFIDLGFEEAVQAAKSNGTLGSLIGLGALLNLLVFFVFIKKRQDYHARGVLMATLLAAITILLLKIF